MLELPTYSIVFVGTFLVGAASAAAAWNILDRQTEPPKPTTPEAPGILRREVLSTLSVLSALLARFPNVGKLRASLAEADMSWSVGRTVLMMLVAGAVTLNVVLRLDFFRWWVLGCSPRSEQRRRFSIFAAAAGRGSEK